MGINIEKFNLFKYKIMRANNFENNVYLDYLHNITCLYSEEPMRENLECCEERGFYFCNNSNGGKSHIVSHLKQCRILRYRLIL